MGRRLIRVNRGDARAVDGQPNPRPGQECVKIDKGFEFPLIHTIRGVGYVLTDSPP